MKEILAAFKEISLKEWIQAAGIMVLLWADIILMLLVF